MMVIFYFSSLPQLKASQFFFWNFVIKKTAHVTEYAILFTLLLRATGKNYLLSFILTLLYASTDEFHQKFTFGRTASVLDVGIDSCGAAIAAYLLWKLNPDRKKKQKKLAKT